MLNWNTLAAVHALLGCGHGLQTVRYLVASSGFVNRFGDPYVLTVLLGQVLPKADVVYVALLARPALQSPFVGQSVQKPVCLVAFSSSLSLLRQRWLQL